MIELLVTAAGLTLLDAEYLWLRAYTPQDGVELIMGTGWESRQQHAGVWVYFAGAKCLNSAPDFPRCNESLAQLGLAEGVEYDLVAWTLAEDQRAPVRDPLVGARRWVYHSGDIDLDGFVDCADVEGFAGAPYDWNLDDATDDADLAALRLVLAAARADLNGDGVIAETDLEILSQSWGDCAPGTPCAADLDCDGAVGMSDLLAMLDLIGS